jgi:hypothetical protein
MGDTKPIQIHATGEAVGFIPVPGLKGFWNCDTSLISFSFASSLSSWLPQTSGHSQFQVKSSPVWRRAGRAAPRWHYSAGRKGSFRTVRTLAGNLSA